MAQQFLSEVLKLLINLSIGVGFKQTYEPASVPSLPIAELFKTMALDVKLALLAFEEKVFR